MPRNGAATAPKRRLRDEVVIEKPDQILRRLRGRRLFQLHQVASLCQSFETNLRASAISWSRVIPIEPNRINAGPAVRRDGSLEHRLGHVDLMPDESEVRLVDERSRAKGFRRDAATAVAGVRCGAADRRRVRTPARSPSDRRFEPRSGAPGRRCSPARTINARSGASTSRDERGGG
jgi:hypothetical protein